MLGIPNVMNQLWLLPLCTETCVAYLVDLFNVMAALQQIVGIQSRFL